MTETESDHRSRQPVKTPLKIQKVKIPLLEHSPLLYSVIGVEPAPPGHELAPSASLV